MNAKRLLLSLLVAVATLAAHAPVASGADCRAKESATVVFSAVAKKFSSQKNGAIFHTMEVFKGKPFASYHVVFPEDTKLPKLKVGEKYLIYADNYLDYVDVFEAFGCGATKVMSEAEGEIDDLEVVWQAHESIKKFYEALEGESEAERVEGIRSLNRHIGGPKGKQVLRIYEKEVDGEKSPAVKGAMLDGLLTAKDCIKNDGLIGRNAMVCGPKSCKILADGERLSASQCRDEVARVMLRDFDQRGEKERLAFMTEFERVTGGYLYGDDRKPLFAIAAADPSAKVRAKTMRTILNGRLPEKSYDQIVKPWMAKEKDPAARADVLEKLVHQYKLDPKNNLIQAKVSCEFWKQEKDVAAIRRMNRTMIQAHQDLFGLPEGRAPYKDPRLFCELAPLPNPRVWNDAEKARYKRFRMCVSDAHEHDFSEDDDRKAFSACQHELPASDQRWGITRGETQHWVDLHDRPFRACFVAHKKRLSRFVPVTYVHKGELNPDGTVYNAWLTATSFDHVPLERCLAKAMMGMKFPKLRGERRANFEVTISYRDPSSIAKSPAEASKAREVEAAEFSSSKVKAKNPAAETVEKIDQSLVWYEPTAVPSSLLPIAYRAWAECFFEWRIRAPEAERDRHRDCAAKLPASAKGPGLTKDEVFIAVMSRRGLLRHCWEFGLARNPLSGGKVTFRGVVNGDGRAVGVKISQSEIKDADFPKCAVESFKRMHFPLPRGGAPTPFEVSVTFDPL